MNVCVYYPLSTQVASSTESDRNLYRIFSSKHTNGAHVIHHFFWRKSYNKLVSRGGFIAPHLTYFKAVVTVESVSNLCKGYSPLARKFNTKVYSLLLVWSCDQQWSIIGWTWTAVNCCNQYVALAFHHTSQEVGTYRWHHGGSRQGPYQLRKRSSSWFFHQWMGTPISMLPWRCMARGWGTPALVAQGNSSAWYSTLPHTLVCHS